MNATSEAGESISTLTDVVDTSEFESLFKKWVAFVKATRGELAEKVVRDMATKMAADEYNHRSGS